MNLVLSIFPGIDLLGRGFEEEGFCIVRGPDLMWGQDVRTFHPVPYSFLGVIGGSPCQDFSTARRSEPSGYGVEMMEEFHRIVKEAKPEWFLHENVPGCPALPENFRYQTQRFFLSARDCGLSQRRNRVFTYGYQNTAGAFTKPGRPLVIPRALSAVAESQPCCMATEGKKASRRAWPDFCEAMGLPRDFDLPGWSVAFKYAAVGNGVPVPMARTIAAAIRNSEDNLNVTLCVCGCGRPVTGKQSMANAACRKRMERERRERDASRLGVTGPVTASAAMSQTARPVGQLYSDPAPVTAPGSVTPAGSQP